MFPTVKYVWFARVLKILLDSYGFFPPCIDCITRVLQLQRIFDTYPIRFLPYR